ncbi:MAG: hypothetical protein EON58_04700 [Alphaproteobacteria bacterium]|nr:MAG: hypothetical protein EON58_04700 [Alphaproteobacteria bacterium]
MTGMQRREAAAYLGVSLSTLDRFASRGRLTRGRAKSKTKPVTVFDPAELESLKAELGQAKPTDIFRRVNSERPQDAIGFRLDPFYVERLKEEGARHGMSPGEYARRLVVRSLEDTATDRFREELHSLREALADTFHAFLTLKCGISPEDATRFVKDTILRGPA